MLVACLRIDTRFKPLGEQLSKHLVSFLVPHQLPNPHVWGCVCGLLHGGGTAALILTGMLVMRVAHWQL